MVFLSELEVCRSTNNPLFWKRHTMSRFAFSPFTYIACWKHGNFTLGKKPSEMVFLSELEVCCSTNNLLFWLLVWSFSLLRWQSDAVERFPNVNRSSEAFQKERSTQSGSDYHSTMKQEKCPKIRHWAISGMPNMPAESNLTFRFTKCSKCNLYIKK